MRPSAGVGSIPAVQNYRRSCVISNLMLLRHFMDGDNISVSELCEITGIPASTIRSWRNRNGLFPHHAETSGWTRYTLDEALALGMVKSLSALGFEAQQAVNLANRMRETFRAAIAGSPSLVGIARCVDDPEVLEHRILKAGNILANEFGWFTDPLVIVVDLQRIWVPMFFDLRAIRGTGDQQSDE